MKQAAIITVIVLLAAVIIAPLAMQGQDAAEEKKGTGIFDVLKSGQPCLLTSVGTRWEITVYRESPKVLGHNITEVGQDFVVIRDFAKVKETRIHLFAIKAVYVVKIGSKPP